MKQVVIEGDVSAVTWGGLGVVGTEIGSGETFKMKFANKGNSAFRDVKLDAKVKVTIEVMENP
jgi:hypothetical protein